MADTISQKVVAWAHGKMRQRVGRGECWDLADQALRASGARTSKTTGRDDNYDWGTPVRIEQVVRGDILQFRNWNVKTTTETTVRFTDERQGCWTSRKRSQRTGRESEERGP